ncbi:uncharacterized protein KY384_007822 [Bacidia gigantensis]|uniref:uncharacterized protein n=1 Tax=Bacidia gigantensis TaxID=2732470 RepID=UPI001D041CC3|nr:uncharacterized protein KY384_007822 [Bacidia gigantensis]KAG8527669.1 hypothetical protein KY384_007822 [Bacidia gigantensis]
MRLINTHSFKLEDAENEKGELDKKYAILSHRWGAEEVTYARFQDLAQASQMQGFRKIERFCELAARDSYDYVWVDTCCINKDSSAELSQAINSMYAWYQDSKVCYVFLGDIEAKDIEVEATSIRGSKWFTRGWTLQELIAPKNVRFYDRHWTFLGTKQTLSPILHLETGIEERILHGGSYDTSSIAQRMSWASKRVTKYGEDIAYCLLGIFNVNMPLLYGEGRKKAFLRLQEEIIKQSDDHTIFSWHIHREDQPGLLADEPKAFSNCQDTKALRSRKGRSPYSLSNRGLSIKLLAAQLTVDTYLVRLECANGMLPVSNSQPNEPRLGIFLRRLYEDDQFARVKYNGETFTQRNASYWTNQIVDPRYNIGAWASGRKSRVVQQLEINVRQDVSSYHSDYHDRIHGFRIATPEILESSKGKDLFLVKGAAQWDGEQKLMLMKPGEALLAGYLDISPQKRKIKVISLGFDFDFNPTCFIAGDGGVEEKTRVLNRLGGLNYGSDAEQAQWTPEEHAQFPGIYQRSPLDPLGWSEVRNGVASDLRQHSGLWALKGDRIEGLEARIGEFATLRIKRGRLGEQMVWDVFLDNCIKETTLKTLFKSSK